MDVLSENIAAYLWFMHFSVCVLDANKKFM